MRKIITTITLILLIGCTNDNDFEKAKKQLTQQGYTNIKNTGYSFLCCDEKDSFSTGFSATDKDGNKIKGCICSGVFKGVTIRFK